MYSIAAVSKLTGLNASTLRSWERRYGVPKPGRSDNGRRQYSEDDVQKLKLVSTLSSLGHTVHQLFSLTTEELERLLAVSDDRSPSPAVRKEYKERLLDAVRNLDISGFRLLLGEAIALLPPAKCADTVIAPLMRDVGEAWFAGDIPIFVEHITSSLVKQALCSTAGPASWTGIGPVVLFGSIQGEQHEIGALLAWHIASLCGWRAIYLGANLPISEFALAANKLGAQAIGLSLVRPYENNRDLEQIRDLASITRCNLWLGSSDQNRFRELSAEFSGRVSVFASFESFENRLNALSVAN